MEKVAQALRHYAASVKIVALPGLPEGGDVSAWVAAGGTAGELERLVQASGEVDSSRFSRFSDFPINRKEKNEKTEEVDFSRFSRFSINRNEKNEKNEKDVNGLGLSFSSGNAYYYHPDQLGSIRALTNSSGSVVDSYSYDAYGNTIASSGSVPNQFRYAGEYQDAESNLYYLRARYYDPAMQTSRVGILTVRSCSAHRVEPLI